MANEDNGTNGRVKSAGGELGCSEGGKFWRYCKGCKRTLRADEFQDGEKEYRQCNKCRASRRQWAAQRKLERQARGEVASGHHREVGDPDTLAAVERLEAEGWAPADWTELAGLPGGFQVIPARRRPGDNGTVWVQLL